MPEISQDERGRRVFQLQKERAVENAITRIRLNLGQDWKLFSAMDIEILQNILGEAWIAADRKEWGSIAFSRVGIREVQEIINLGKNLKTGEGMGKVGIPSSLMEILKRTVK
jgi:hypothetical protein